MDSDSEESDSIDKNNWQVVNSRKRYDNDILHKSPPILISDVADIKNKVNSFLRISEDFTYKSLKDGQVR